MKNKNIKNQIWLSIGVTTIFIILILSGIFLIKADSKKVILTSIYNTSDILKNKNYENKVEIEIKTKENQTSKISYKSLKSNDKYKLNIKQYSNNKLLNSNINYIEKDIDHYNFYYKLDNNWNKISINDLNSKLKFNIDYTKLVKNIKSYNYVGKVKVSNKKLYKYSVKLKEYEAYNFLYSSSIMSKNNSNKSTKLYLYIDKKNEIIYTLEYQLKNIKDKNQKYQYNVLIENNDIGNTLKINIPDIK